MNQTFLHKIFNVFEISGLKTKYFLLIFSLLLFLLSACVQDSAISDVEISDAKLIQPQISLLKSIDRYNKATHSIACLIYDKNGNLVRIKNGSVYVNGYEMELVDYAFSVDSAQYYSAQNVYPEVKPEFDYNFEIELSDGKLYQADIVTQKDLWQLNVPERHNISNDLTISWKEISDSISVTTTIYFVEAGRNKQIETQRELSEDDLTNGSYTIKSEEFLQFTNPYEISISVESFKEGIISESFRDGKFIKSVFKIYKSIELF